MNNQEEIRNVSFRDMMADEYGIVLFDDECEEIISVMDEYRIQPTEVTFQVETSWETYLNSLIEYRRLNFKRSQFDILISDVIYEMYPNPNTYPVDENIDCIYPHHVHHRLSTNVKETRFDKETHNIAIIRELNIVCKENEKSINNYYTFVILNTELDVRAGIRFESIK